MTSHDRDHIAEPEETADKRPSLDEARDAKGRWLPGHSGGPGRPRGVDIKRLAREKELEDGSSIEEAMWDVLKAMLRAASKGNVAAAKLCGEWVNMKDAHELLVHHAGESGPPVPPTQDYQDPVTGKWKLGLLNSARKLAELAHELVEDAESD